MRNAKQRATPEREYEYDYTNNNIITSNATAIISINNKTHTYSLTPNIMDPSKSSPTNDFMMKLYK
jgi:hypothetical protein